MGIAIVASKTRDLPGFVPESMCRVRWRPRRPRGESTDRGKANSSRGTDSRPQEGRLGAAEPRQTNARTEIMRMPRLTRKKNDVCWRWKIRLPVGAPVAPRDACLRPRRCSQRPGSPLRVPNPGRATGFTGDERLASTPAGSPPPTADRVAPTDPRLPRTFPHPQSAVIGHESPVGKNSEPGHFRFEVPHDRAGARRNVPRTHFRTADR